MNLRTSLPSLKLILFGLCATLLLALAVPAPARAQSLELDEEEKAFFKIINDYRVQNGLAPLKVSVILTTAAKWLANDWVAKSYISHEDSKGRDPYMRLTEFGYTMTNLRGENIAGGFATAAQVFEAWKNSQNHNDAMLNRNFRAIGIARISGGLYPWNWVTDFGAVVEQEIPLSYTPPPTTPPPPPAPALTTVNAASYTGTITPDGIAAAFGSSLSAGTFTAPSLPLPTSLGGTSVTVNGAPAQLLYVSPSQINFVVPTDAAAGQAAIVVNTAGRVAATGTVNVSPVAPAFFTAKSDGQGAPAGFSTYDGQNLTPLTNGDGTPRVVAAGADVAPNYLVLFGTGFRNRSSLYGLQVFIGNVAAKIQYAGAQPSFVGLDQLNLELPRELRGRGEIELVLTVDGRTANRVKINVGY